MVHQPPELKVGRSLKFPAAFAITPPDLPRSPPLSRESQDLHLSLSLSYMNAKMRVFVSLSFYVGVGAEEGL